MKMRLSIGIEMLELASLSYSPEPKPWQMVYHYQVSKKETEWLFYRPIDQNILRFTMHVR